jgi:hypothetical protein
MKNKKETKKQFEYENEKILISYFDVCFFGFV